MYRWAIPFVDTRVNNETSTPVNDFCAYLLVHSFYFFMLFGGTGK